MNVVTLIGRLTKDPENRVTAGGTAVCNASIAVDRPAKDGEKQADFINLIMFGKTAETFGKFMTKGRQVGIEGRIQSGSYQNKEGKTVYTTDVLVNRFHFIGSKSDAPAGNPKPQYTAPEGFDAIEDGIPF